MGQTIEKTSVERYTVINDGGNLDKFSVTLEGNKVDVSCWDSVSSYYWGSPGEKGIKHFLTSIDFYYWSSKLFYEKTDSFFDREATLKRLKERIIEERREGGYRLCRQSARELWDYFEEVVNFSDKRECEVWAYERLYDDLERTITRREDAKNAQEMFNPFEGGLEIVSGCQPHLLHMWFNGWLPFVKHLCEELNIEYKQPSGPERPYWVR